MPPLLRLTRHKVAIRRDRFEWYPFDSFGTIFEQVLSGRHRWLSPLIGDEPVLDTGLLAMARFRSSWNLWELAQMPWTIRRRTITRCRE